VLSPLTLTSFKKGGLQRAGWTLFCIIRERESWSRRVEEEEKRG